MATIQDNIVQFKSTNWLRPKSLRDRILDFGSATFQNPSHVPKPTNYGRVNPNHLSKFSFIICLLLASQNLISQQLPRLFAVHSNERMACRASTPCRDLGLSIVWGINQNGQWPIKFIICPMGQHHQPIPTHQLSRVEQGDFWCL